MNNDLKPCPFCGGEAGIIHDRTIDGNVSFGSTRIVCKNCKCQTQEYANDGYYGERYSDSDVASIWNRRANDE